MPRAVSRCPQCGEPVSPFAAGCVICGTDLEAARARLAARRRPAVPRLRTPALQLRIDWVHVAVAYVLALAAAPIGFLLSLYWALQRHRTGEPAMTAAMLGSAALAAATFLAPAWFYSRMLAV
jgi:hypothetical protein